jgi:hypothetical protein
VDGEFPIGDENNVVSRKFLAQIASAAQENSGRAAYSPQLLRSDRVVAFVEAFSRFYLDKRDRIAFLGDNVYLAASGFVSSSKYFIALDFQEADGQKFSEIPLAFSLVHKLALIR